MPQSFICLHAHITFSTKNREPLITAEFAPRLFEYIGGICRGEGNALVGAGGTPDHVHLLVSLGKQASASDLVRDVKSNSSGWIHDEFPQLRGFAWQAGYGAFGVSFSQLDPVRAYLARQEEHHRGRSFQEEFLAFLKRHRLPYDERHIWD
jgi:REP element-mobilizing transposase RayT